MFVIEDEAHAYQFGEYICFEDAIAKLRRLSTTPWDEAPNVAPCTSWRTCGRRYQILEYDNKTFFEEVMRQNLSQQITVIPTVNWIDGIAF